jgi:hypothetical protein
MADVDDALKEIAELAAKGRVNSETLYRLCLLRVQYRQTVALETIAKWCENNWAIHAADKKQTGARK